MSVCDNNLYRHSLITLESLHYRNRIVLKNNILRLMKGCEIEKIKYRIVK